MKWTSWISCPGGWGVNTIFSYAIYARQILGVVATSAPSERDFSTGGNVVTQQRQRLDPQNVDKLIFLSANSAAKKK